MLYGRTNAYLASRFLKEIPEEFVQRKGGVRVQPERPTYGAQATNAQSVARREQIKRSQQSSLTAASSAPKAVLELSKGDMIQHKAFGRGMVLTATKIGNDTLLEIAFDGVGTKKMFANTASVHMKKL